MLPVKRTNGHGLIPEFFNDFFEGNLMNRISSGSPAMNVFEDDKEYKLEIAAPGMQQGTCFFHHFAMVEE